MCCPIFPSFLQLLAQQDWFCSVFLIRIDMELSTISFSSCLWAVISYLQYLFAGHTRSWGFVSRFILTFSTNNAEYYRLPGTSNSSHLILGQVGVYNCRAGVRNWYIPITSYWLMLSYSNSSNLGFAVCLGLSVANAGSVLEWCIAFIFTFYIASFFIDLRPAVHTRHKVSGDVTEMEVAANDERSQQHANRL